MTREEERIRDAEARADVKLSDAWRRFFCALADPDYRAVEAPPAGANHAPSDAR